MEPKITSALIAGGVSLIVSLVTYYATKSKIKSERAKLERELERKLTEKLYDRRMNAYPKAFSITNDLLGYIIDDDTFSRTDTDKIYKELSDWISSDASFILSKNSLNSFYDLRESLLVNPTNGDSYSKKQKKNMWKCKNKFRSALRNDVKLLFLEDIDKKENDFMEG